MNILVLDSNQRSALAVVRSLGKLQLSVHTCDYTPNSLAGSSKFSVSYAICPSPVIEPERFIDWLGDYIKNNHIDYVFPVTEVSSQLILKHRDELPQFCKIPFADLETVLKLADKGNLVNLAQQMGVPVPGSRFINKSIDLDINSVEQFPVVLKPALSRRLLNDGWLETEVKVCYNRNELQDVLSTDKSFEYPFLLQEFIPGKGAGVFAIYDHGRAVAFFAHKRVREKPPGGGVSVLSESVKPDPQLLAYTESLLGSVNWHGVAMVEFRVTEDGKPYLMEVNTRFWGSLQLAIDSGVDFPKLLYQISQGEEPVRNNGEYTISQQLRWFLGDFDSLYLYVKDSRVSFCEKVGRFFQFLTPKIANRRHETNRLEDLNPAWFELKQYVKELIN